MESNVGRCGALGPVGGLGGGVFAPGAPLGPPAGGGGAAFGSLAILLFFCVKRSLTLVENESRFIVACTVILFLIFSSTILLCSSLFNRSFNLSRSSSASLSFSAEISSYSLCSLDCLSSSDRSSSRPSADSSLVTISSIAPASFVAS